MAEIIINEVSQNYSYNIGANSYATVALPITACWGPGLEASIPADITADKLEELTWQHFPATQAGLESFVATYRGPASIYRTVKDYSYQAAMSLLSAGYDVLVCRVATGLAAQGTLTAGGNAFAITAKYAGTFGNNLKVSITEKNGIYNLITFVIDNYGSQTALENLYFVVDETKVTDTIPYIDEFESKYVNIVVGDSAEDMGNIRLSGGTDYANDDVVTVDNFRDWYNYRYSKAYPNESSELVHDSKLFKCIIDGDRYRGLEVTSKLFGNESTTVTLLTERASEATSAATQILLTVLIGETTSYLHFGDDVLEVYHYDAVTGDTAPTWEANTYYIKDSIFYSLTESEPADWSTNWTDYYTKGALIGTYNPISSFENDRVSIASVDTGIMDGTLIPSITQTIGGTASPSYDASEYGSAIYAVDDNTLTPFMFYRQSIYSMAYTVYDSLTDKLTYNFQRVISPGWDDQDISEFGQTFTITPIISALHVKLMQIGYYSRCGTAYLDVPKALPRRFVSIPDGDGYAQKLARYQPTNVLLDVNVGLYTTHSALFAPWGQYTYVGTSKQATASPSFLALLIQRAMILNQSIQYEWCLPTNRSHNLRLGKFDYTIPAHLLKEWQGLTGVGVNCLTSLPDLGNTLWGNSTLFEIPPATYQALANLSTRFLVNAIEDIVYRCGIAITFQYNNGQAYDKFYAGVTPLLDTMKNVGAIKDYYVTMAADINGLDQVNANSVIGTIYITPVGVITSITVDLIALPPQTDLTQFAE